MLFRLGLLLRVVVKANFDLAPKIPHHCLEKVEIPHGNR